MSENYQISKGEVIAPPIKYRSFKRFYANKAAFISLVFIILFNILCFFPKILSRFPQNDINENRKRLPISATHWLGTDVLGRDNLTELLYAGQISLKIGLFVGIISTLLGAVVGAYAGYYGKWIDSILMRMTDLFLCVPTLIMLALALRKFGDGDISMIFCISAISWMYAARLVRSKVLSLKTRDYVDAAKINGRSGFYIIFKHLIPNSFSVIAVNAALTISAAIGLESTISFLGFGIQPPLTSWGRMLYDSKGYAVGKYSYIFLAPAISVFLVILAFNFISDGLRDALDPRSEQS
ncbi:MAG: ABC transporter permease [Acidimicrobiia bacterium]